MMKHLFTKMATGLATLGLLGMLTACGNADAATLNTGSWDETVAAAEEEGSVTFYSGLSEIQNTRLIEAFNEAHPEIKVNTQRGSGELVPRVESEMSAGTTGADVFALGDTAWYKNKDEELLPLNGPARENWKSEGWANEGSAPIVNATPNAIFVWNTDIFPEGFSDWDDLLAPKVKGKIGLRTDVTKSVAGYLDMMETELGADYLEKIGAQDPKVYTSVVPMTQSVASGEIGVTNASLPSTVFELQQNGAPIESHVPTPGYAFEFGMAALKNASNPNAAVVFTDFAMSAEGQAALNGDGFGASQGLDNVPGALDLSGSTMMESDKYTPEVIAEWDKKLAEIYNQ